MNHYVCHDIDGDLDLTCLTQSFPERYPHLLESVAHGTDQARFSILFAFPGDSLRLQPDRQLYWNDTRETDSDFLAGLNRYWKHCASMQAPTPDQDAAQTPFTGGWFVFLSYELVMQLERPLAALPVDADWPLAVATRFPAAIIFDHVRQRNTIVCENGQADTLIAMIHADISTLRSTPGVSGPDIAIADLIEDEPDRYLAGVSRIKDYIRAGDVFQVNLSRAWRLKLTEPVSAVTLYRRLSRANPAPFAGLATFAPGQAIISSSPERLVQVRQGTVRTRPIAGTYPRSAEPEQDQTWSRELLQHPKERAEHVMLIDLERNDLGRICRPGTVRVNEHMVLESYRHVHHIVSEITGELAAGCPPGDIIRAVFPGGTITGCPKVRTMEIIAELEQLPRGAYTGSMGYINHDGSMDMNILIRTMTLKDNLVWLRAGAGIVADSVPERELSETRAKAKGLLAALGAV